jgi:hypothetical protein
MELNLSEMEVKKALKIMISEAGIDHFTSLAREIGLKETTFRSAISEPNEHEQPPIRLRDFLKAAEVTGYEVIVRKKSTGV